MKINELVLRNRFVVEAGPVPPAAPAAPAAAPAAKGPGLWDKLKAGVAGAKASYTSSQAQRAGTEMAGEVASTFIERWNKAIAQNPALNTPEQLQAYMTNSTKQSGIKVPAAPAQLNPAITSKYITDVISQSMAARSLGVPSAREPEPSAAEQGPQLDPGVAVVSDNPMVLRYGKDDYAINDQGQWAKSNNQKATLSQAMQEFLDKQERAILSYKPPQQQQAQPQPQAQAASQQAAVDSTATTATSTDQAAMDRLGTITQPKSFASGTQVPVTKVTQQPSTVATTQSADELIANANPEDLEAMLAALEGPQA